MDYNGYNIMDYIHNNMETIEQDGTFKNVKKKHNSLV